MDYRREIDGLRAVAVIPVILFHAGFQTFSGGFVGVDVFFVISGYLITTIILSEKESGTFSLVNFYERRTRRILPALFLVMLFTIPMAWLWLLPSDMKSFSHSLIAVSTFSSNIFFWKTSGYWGEPNELLPLLHTWSLAVEEQYYLIFPLFLMLVWRFRKRWIFSSFMIIAAASLLLAQLGAYRHPTANFFLLITRGWELAIGAGIAFYFLYRKSAMRSLLSHRLIDEVMGVVGILMIAYAVFFFDERIPFPSVYALVPTVGTGLIIVFSSPTTLVGRVLGINLFVGIGLVSYSAYLWHLPLFAFAKYRSLTAPNELLILMLSISSILLAYLSWRFVEKPFRNKKMINRKAVFSFAACGSLFFITVGAVGHVTDGWPARIDGNLLSLVDAAKLPNRGRELCLANDGSSSVTDESCALVHSDGKYAYLFGDSHAMAMAREMQRAFDRADIGLIQATERGCPPIQDVYVYVSESDRVRCFSHNESVYRDLESSVDVEYVVLVTRWALYIETNRFDNTEGGMEREEVLLFDALSEGETVSSSMHDTSAYFSQAYKESVERLLQMGKKVILVYPIPEVGWNVPRYVRNHFLSNGDQAFSPKTGSTSHDVFRNRNSRAYEALDSIGEHPGLYRVYPEKIFCNKLVRGRCIVQKDNLLLYADDDHLSDAGAALVVKDIIAFFD